MFLIITSSSSSSSPPPSPPFTCKYAEAKAIRYPYLASAFSDPEKAADDDHDHDGHFMSTTTVIHKTSPMLVPNETDVMDLPSVEVSQSRPHNRPSTIRGLPLALEEAYSIAKIALPMILTGLVLYCRSMISMLFLGRLGELALAGGSLALGFANITGYSVMSGLAMGMEPICGQAFGAKKHSLLGLTLQRTVLLLMLISLPISLLWLNMKRILLICGQDEDISSEAQSYLLYSVPDLLALSILHPIRIYLRTQSITLPLTVCAALSIIMHVPINYLLVSHLGLGIRGVALSGVWTNFNLVASLIIYILVSGIHKKTWGGFSLECLRGWTTLMNLAIPSCISVCLEWWWYEIMILLCGLLLNPRATVASMGILIQTTSLIYIFPSSLSFSISTRVSNELGANQPAKARFAAIVGLGASIMLGLSATVFSVSVRNVWATMFTADKEIAALTSLVLPIIGLCELGNCPQTTGCGVLRGTASPKIGANINLGSFYLVGMPVAVGLAFFMGFDFEGLWLGMLAAQGSCVVAMLTVLARMDWKLQARKAQVLITASGRERGRVGGGGGGDNKNDNEENGDQEENVPLTGGNVCRGPTLEEEETKRDEVKENALNPLGVDVEVPV